MTFPLSTTSWNAREVVSDPKLQYRFTSPLNALYLTLTTTLAGLPVARKSGQLAITPVANTPTLGSLTWTTGYFTKVPIVSTTANTQYPGDGSAVTGVYGSAVTSITVSGCTLVVTRNDTITTTLAWVAQQDTL